MDDRAGEVGEVEELGRERAGEERLEAEVAAALGVDQPVVAEGGGEAVPGRDTVVRVQLRRAAAHDLRHPGIRAD